MITQKQQEDDRSKVILTDGGEDKQEPKAKSFYLKPETHRKLNRWLKRLELEHIELEDSKKHHQYEAIVRLALENENEFINKVKKLSKTE